MGVLRDQSKENETPPGKRESKKSRKKRTFNQHVEKRGKRGEMNVRGG